MPQRDDIKNLSPPWLRVGNGERYMYNIGLGADALLQKCEEGLLAAMPGLGTYTALPYIGNDRVMAQGPNEANADFAGRLTRAYDTWRYAGSARSVLGQAMSYAQPGVSELVTQGVFTEEFAPALIVHRSGGGTCEDWDIYLSSMNPVTSTPIHLREAPGNNTWNWDGNYYRAQSFLILNYPVTDLGMSGSHATVVSASGGFPVIGGTGLTSGSFTAPLADAVYNLAIELSGCANAANNGIFQITGFNDSLSQIQIANSAGVFPDANSGSITWSVVKWPTTAPAPPWGIGQTWGGLPNQSWGLSVSNQYVTALQSLIRLWKSAGTFYPVIIFSFGATIRYSVFYTPYPGAGSNPDGTWGHWGTNVAGLYQRSRISSVVTYADNGANRFDAFTDGSAVYQQCFEPTGT